MEWFMEISYKEEVKRLISVAESIIKDINAVKGDSDD